MNIKLIEKGENDKYQLLEPLVYHSKRYNLDVSIPEGFAWDGSSGVPDLHPFLASCVHDYIYRTPTVDISRYRADMMYYDLLSGFGYKLIPKIRLIGLRLFGRAFYLEREKTTI